MKKLQVLIICFIVYSFWGQAQVGIGTTSPDSSALLDVKSNSKGLLIPRLTTIERNQINHGTIAEGLMIYNLDSKSLEIFDGTDWNKVLMENATIKESNTELLNGSFENWTEGKLDHWFFEEGIEVEEDSTIIYKDKRSVKIKLSTTEQGLTDFRQTILLEKGIYEFSFFVYHSDKASRVRLFTEVFKNYSNPSIINEWQEVKSTFTVDDEQEIEVGFRFYDTDYFTNFSTLYLDNVQLIKK